MNFQVIFLLRFYAIEHFWKAEDSNKPLKAFREGGCTRHAADVLRTPGTCLRRRILVEGKKSKAIPVTGREGP
jgi:hypothetical protein